jgi:hypothetical protein
MAPAIVSLLVLVPLLCGPAPAQDLPEIVIDAPPTAEQPTIEGGQSEGAVFEPPATFGDDPMPPVTVTFDGRPLALPESARLVEGKYVLCPGSSVLRQLHAQVTQADDGTSVEATLGPRSIRWEAGTQGIWKNERYSETRAKPIMEGQHLFIPLKPSAKNLGYRVSWDRDTMTADVRTPPKTATQAFQIAQSEIGLPRLWVHGSDALVVTGTVFSSGQKRLLYADGSQRGTSWTTTRLPLPEAINTGIAPFGAWAMGSDFVFCYGGFQERSMNTARTLPLWFGGKGLSWRGCQSGPHQITNYRLIEDLLVAHPRAQIMYAAESEFPVPDYTGEASARLWRTTDTGLTWNLVTIGGEKSFIGVRLAETDSSGAAWVVTQSLQGPRLARLHPTGNAYVPSPSGMGWTSRVSVPQPDTILVAYNRSVVGPADWVLVRSTDRGKNWQTVHPNFWAVNGMDWLDERFGIIHGGPDANRALYWTRDGGQNWWRHRLPGWEVLPGSLTAVSNMEAYMLARKADSDDRRLHCLRWELGW